MLLRPGLEIFKLPDFLKAFHTVDDGRDLADQS